VGLVDIGGIVTFIVTRQLILLDYASAVQSYQCMASNGSRTSSSHECAKSLPALYREFPPGSFLAPFIECFWTSTVRPARESPACYRVLPDGCMDFLFDFNATTARRVSLVGTMTRPLSVVTTGAVDLLGIRFRPGGLSMFCALDAAELTDASADLSEFWGHFAEELWHELAGATLARRLSRLQEVLGARANGRLRPDPFIHHCIARIDAAHGSLRIADLEKGTGLGGRQLERKFSAQIGISPKAFARVIRFKHVAAAARSKSANWARLAADFGFADQSHLVREFKAFAGVTPSAYLHASGE
jgi:AraC-like DNA-binding protein